MRVVALVLAIATLAPGRAFADDWDVRLAADVTVTPGEAATLSLTIAGEGGRVISKDGPVRVALSSSTLTLPRVRYERKQAADPAADAPRFDLKLTAPSAGDHALAIDVHFWLCGKKVCRPVHVTRTVTVHAVAPATAAAPAPAPKA